MDTELNQTSLNSQEMKKISFTVWLSLIGVVGVLGNISIIVYYPSNRKMNSVTGLFIKVLAWVDLLTCVSIPYAIVFELGVSNNIYFCKILEYVRSHLIGSSNLVMVCCALERYMAICRPLCNFSRRIAIGIVVAVLTAITLSAIPVIFLTKADNVGNNNIEYFQLSGIFCYIDRTSMGSKVYGIFLLCVVVTADVTMVTMYVLIFKRLRKQHLIMKGHATVNKNTNVKTNCVVPKPRDETNLNDFTTREKTLSSIKSETENGVVKIMDSKTITNNKNVPSNGAWVNSKKSTESKHTRIAVMLLSVTAVYIISWMPFFIMAYGFVAYIPHVNYFFYVNNATNFIFYLWFNREFRAIVKGKLSAICS